MEEKTYRIYYKNGKSIECKAYSMELTDGKLYQCCKAWVGDMGVPNVLDAHNIDHVEEVTERRAYRIRALTGLSQAAFAKKYNIPKRSIESWESTSDTSGREAPEYVLDLLERAVKEDFNVEEDDTMKTSKDWDQEDRKAYVWSMTDSGLTDDQLYDLIEKDTKEHGLSLSPFEISELVDEIRKAES